MTLATALAAALVLGAGAVLRGPPPASRLHRVVPTPVGVGTVRHLWHHARVAWARRQHGPAVRVLAELWAAELRAGHPVDRALAVAIDAHPSGAVTYPRTATAARLHADVAGALRADAADLRPRDRAAVRALAACWTVGRGGGGGLADAVERVGESVRAAEIHRAHVRAELAGARSSARLLAAMPLLVLGTSSALGLASPSAVVSNGWAVGSLLAGLVLAAVGVWWTERIARAAERAA